MIGAVVRRTWREARSLIDLRFRRPFSLTKQKNAVRPASIIRNSATQTAESWNPDLITSFTRKANIAFPGTFKILKAHAFIGHGAKNKVGLNVRVSDRHIMNKHALKYLDQSGHAYREITLKRLAAKKFEPLWVEVVIYAEHAIVRRKGKYRIGAALFEALRRNGFDKTGRRMPQVVDGLPSGAVAEIRGSLKLDGRYADVHQTDFETLVGFCEHIVRYMEKNHGKTNNGGDATRQPHAR